MYNTWNGPKAAVSTASNEVVSLPIKRVTTVSHKAGCDLSVIYDISSLPAGVGKDKRSWFTFRFGTQVISVFLFPVEFID